MLSINTTIPTPVSLSKKRPIDLVYKDKDGNVIGGPGATKKALSCTKSVWHIDMKKL